MDNFFPLLSITVDILPRVTERDLLAGYFLKSLSVEAFGRTVDSLDSLFDVATTTTMMHM